MERFLDKKALEKMGIGNELREIENGICPNCHQKVDIQKLNFKYDFEFELIGFCADCIKKQMEHIRICIDAKICSRCLLAIIPEEFESLFQIKMYLDTGVCPECQKEIVNKYKKALSEEGNQDCQINND